MKRYKKGNNIFITEYNSIGEFVADINSLPDNKFFANRSKDSQARETSDHWYKTKDYSEAMDLLTHGWNEASEKITKKVKLNNTVGTPVRSSKPSYGVVGSQASVPRYLQGIPTNMVFRKSIYSKQKVITITKGISYSCECSSQFIINESIKALQLIQALENKGQRVRLNVVLSVSNHSRSSHSICKVCIKQPDERINISKMAFALAHPSMLRRFFFKWIEVDPFTTFDLGYGYGYPATPDIKEKGVAENEYYIPEKIQDMNALITQLTNGKSRKDV